MAHSVEKIASSPFTPAASRIAAWIMPRLPQWVTPNHITGPGCAVYLAAGSAFYLASFSQAWFVGAAICIFLHRVTDNLAGEPARTLAAGRVTRLGGMTAAAPACMVRRNGRRRIEQRRDYLIDAGQEQVVPDREHHTGRSCASPGLRWGGLRRSRRREAGTPRRFLSLGRQLRRCCSLHTKDAAWGTPGSTNAERGATSRQQ